MSKLLLVFGTRPEAIKMSPVFHALKEQYEIKVCVTAQHRQMLDQVLSIFNIVPDYDLNVMEKNQDLFSLTSKILLSFKAVLNDFRPDLVLVHGDTTTAMSAALASFYQNIPVGHIEAGLRTHKIDSPFPEEMNRQVVSRIANLHFSPTLLAKNNLMKEGIKEANIHVTGNTVIDALFSKLDIVRKKEFSDSLISSLPFLSSEKISLNKIVLVTGHRRENFGRGFKEICEALREIAVDNPEIRIVYPVHMNPNVLEPVNKILSGIDNIYLIQPLDYLDFIKLMDISYFILTDSGGIQEEAPSLGKPVLVMRDNTERPEAVDAKTVILVGPIKTKIVSSVNRLLSDEEMYEAMSKAHNPYGDGKASQRILKIIKDEYQ